MLLFLVCREKLSCVTRKCGYVEKHVNVEATRFTGCLSIPYNPRSKELPVFYVLASAPLAVVVCILAIWLNYANLRREVTVRAAQSHAAPSAFS
jgi:hypothetical protein